MSARAVPAAGIHPLQRLHGVPESELTDALAARLPAGSPPAPWATTVEAVFWVHRATGAAPALVPPALRRRPRIPLTVATFVRYLDTPVGPYREILAAPTLLADRRLTASTIPFIAVDSIDSVHGGRANWALPKTLARFDWSAPEGQLGDGRSTIRARGEESAAPWSVEATLTPRGRRVSLPLPLPLRNVQETPEGRPLTVDFHVTGEAQLARIDVRCTGPSLPSWLRAGRHLAVVIPHGRMTFGVAR